MRVFGALAVGLALLIPLGCSRKADNDSLRDGLSRIPEETAAAPEVEVDTQAYTPPILSGPAALPDTAGLPSSFPDAVTPPPVLTQPPADAPDTARGPLKPGPPRDTRPWIPGTPRLPAAGWTIEPTDVRGGGMPVVLTRVRAARNAGFDRVVFEFEGEQLPGYHLEYLADTPRQCGSGRRAAVAGGARLLVRLTPAQAHDFEGHATLANQRIVTGLATVPELRQICDFEGQVGWALGVDAVRPYRVTSLRNPARLVVDVGGG